MSNLVLEQVQDPEVAEFTRRQTAVIWKGKYTVEEYIERDNKTSNGELSKVDPETWSGLYVFVLKNLDLPETDKFSQIVSSCETINRTVYHVQDGVLQELVSSCIGGVFCLPQHRRKGYSATMIELLNKYWEERLPQKSYMSLYSEVGEYYSRVGYKSFEVPVHKIKLSEDYQVLAADLATLEHLKYEQYEHLISKFDQDLKSNLINQSKQNNSRVIYSAKPTLSQFTWYHIRDIHACSKIRKDINKPVENNFGVKLDDSNYIIWNHEWHGDQLLILKVQVTSLNNLVQLFQLAMVECHNLKLKEIYLWDSCIDSALREEFRGYLRGLSGSDSIKVEMDLENGSVSAIRPFDETVRENVDYSWEQNEKWCWF
ncbi:hypothetical protein WICPIJ_000227 [Wickerhamomyces pijperi]|uniref:LYC1 C-terminal domain-containing protein n=1 Tax=Wickerhamomyces pijperi TaxID=599730 RepID=A0A9P8QE67_WICPI|nr:hypothetical protein WICPIJ_000227 [Wickerhamomyces pijperi]